MKERLVDRIGKKRVDQKDPRLPGLAAKIARDVVSDHLVRLGLRKKIEVKLSEAVIATACAPEPGWPEDERLRFYACLDEALALLDPTRRLIFEETHLSGKSGRETAEAMGIPETTFRGMLEDAKAGIRNFMKSKGFYPP